MMTITTKDINIENNATTFEICSGGHVFCEVNDVDTDWSALAPDVQSRLEGIEREIEALIIEGRRLVANG